MKLVHPDFYCQIECKEDEILVLVLESPDCFLKFVSELRQQIDGEEGRWVLSHNTKTLKISKECDIVIDPFSIDINQRKMIAALYNQFEDEVLTTELLLNWNSVYPFLVRIMEKIGETSDYVLSYREDMEVKDFLKFMDLRFSDIQGDIIEKLIDYMILAQEVLGVQLFILVNIKSYLNSTNLKYLYEQAFYKKIKIILLEKCLPEEKNILEKIIIVDKDGCLIE